MSSKQKILIVEDEQSIINFVTAVLTANGYDVILASTGFCKGHMRFPGIDSRQKYML